MQHKGVAGHAAEEMHQQRLLLETEENAEGGSESSSEEESNQDSEQEDASDDGSGDESVASIIQIQNQTKAKRNHRPPDDWNIKQFRKYCELGERSFIRLNRKQVRGIKLLDILRRNKSPLTAYDDHIGWYLEETGKRIANEPIGEVPDYLSRKKLMKTLKERYNMSDKFPFQRKIKLPHSGATIKVVCLSAHNVVWQLLADPRLTDDDFCFFDKDPLAPPPESITKVGQLNTGEAYRNAYFEYVDDPSRQMGIGIQ